MGAVLPVRNPAATIRENREEEATLDRYEQVFGQAAREIPGERQRVADPAGRPVTVGG